MKTGFALAVLVALLSSCATSSPRTATAVSPTSLASAPFVKCEPRAVSYLVHEIKGGDDGIPGPTLIRYGCAATYFADVDYDPSLHKVTVGPWRDKNGVAVNSVQRGDCIRWRVTENNQRHVRFGIVAFINHDENRDDWPGNKPKNHCKGCGPTKDIEVPTWVCQNELKDDVMNCEMPVYTDMVDGSYHYAMTLWHQPAGDAFEHYRTSDPDLEVSGGPNVELETLIKELLQLCGITTR